MGKFRREEKRGGENQKRKGKGRKKERKNNSKQGKKGGIDLHRKKHKERSEEGNGKGRDEILVW